MPHYLAISEGRRRGKERGDQSQWARHLASDAGSLLYISQQPCPRTLRATPLRTRAWFCLSIFCTHTLHTHYLPHTHCGTPLCLSARHTVTSPFSCTPAILSLPFLLSSPHASFLSAPYTPTAYTYTCITAPLTWAGTSAAYLCLYLALSCCHMQSGTCTHAHSLSLTTTRATAAPLLPHAHATHTHRRLISASLACTCHSSLQGVHSLCT